MLRIKVQLLAGLVLTVPVMMSTQQTVAHAANVCVPAPDDHDCPPPQVDPLQCDASNGQWDPTVDNLVWTSTSVEAGAGCPTGGDATYADPLGIACLDVGTVGCRSSEVAASTSGGATAQELAVSVDGTAYACGGPYPVAFSLNSAKTCSGAGANISPSGGVNVTP